RSARRSTSLSRCAPARCEDCTAEVAGPGAVASGPAALTVGPEPIVWRCRRRGRTAHSHRCTHHEPLARGGRSGGTMNTTDIRTYGHWIDGGFVDPAGGDWFDSHNPYTGEVWARIARGDEQDVDRAVEAATRAQVEWAARTPTDRGKVLVQLAELIEENSEALAEVEVRDNGKLYAEMS